MDYTTWLSLAYTQREPERLLALETAMADAERFQTELLYGCCQNLLPIQLKAKIYPLLNEENQNLIASFSFPKIEVYPLKKEVSKEKESWADLAKSSDHFNREIALEILSGNPKPYQQEIQNWLTVQEHFLIYHRLYNLLSKPNQEKFNTVIYPDTLPIDGSLKIVLLHQNKILVKAILQTIYELSGSFWNYKLQLVKNYRSLAGCTLREAIDVAEYLWADDRWRKR
jgi:hypothetical protein